jgi:hypothetical protein
MYQWNKKKASNKLYYLDWLYAFQGFLISLIVLRLKLTEYFTSEFMMVLPIRSLAAMHGETINTTNTLQVRF